jgi:hypothetical protein
VYVADGTVTLSGDILDDNAVVGGAPGGAADARGGGLCVTGGTVNLSNDTVNGNQAIASNENGALTPIGSAYGGGICVAAGTVVLCNNAIQSNLAVGSINAISIGNGFGGGTYIFAAAAIYMDSLTVANTINNTDYSGMNNTANIDGAYILQNC